MSKVVEVLGGVGDRNPRRRVYTETKNPEQGNLRGGERGKNEMDVEGKDDREGSDVSHPRGARLAREEREWIGGENERKSLTGCEGMEVGV